ncbi:hypothetical protein Lalb_Chr01g0016341 [Lupinus albus]|uniref:Uncharacterized protein n=1 Tax=Lupinus albus TaxID=3870 RepID=A0A6A4R8M0_LUPAL|nr:hypothetical protein Lalb_Chr01g0016341 [Lupinus albus]
MVGKYVNRGVNVFVEALKTLMGVMFPDPPGIVDNFFAGMTYNFSHILILRCLTGSGSRTNTSMMRKRRVEINWGHGF